MGVSNVLEFYLSRGCNVTIVPVDSIRTNVRLNWTLDEFYSGGGTTKFVDRLAASLGIKAANVKIVNVYMGSVFVDFHITDPTNTLATTGGLSAVASQLTTLLNTNTIDLGAPILSSTVTQVTAP